MESGLHVGILAVEQAQRVLLGLRSDLLGLGLEVRHRVLEHRFAIARPAFASPEGIQQNRNALDPEHFVEAYRHFDNFGVGGRGWAAHQLQTDLVRLAEPALLGPLVAEHGRDVIQPLHRARREQAVFDQSSHSGSRALRL